MSDRARPSAPDTGRDRPGAARAAALLDGLPGLAGDLSDLYRDLHRHPELSMHEHRTASMAAERLAVAGFEVVAGVGGTGVVGVLRNGDGPTVMLRADMDALPMREDTGLDYASTDTGVDATGAEVPVAHACGHDMHVTWLAGAAALLADGSERWRGTVMAVFQPGEETAEGARAMVDDGLLERFPAPDLILGQHVMPMPAGWIGYRPGVTLAAGDSFAVRMFGRGGHGSWPEATVDPVVMAAATVLRLQGIVSREVAAADVVNLTVGSIQAGTKDNIIPDEALLKLKVRTFDERVRDRVLAAMRRVVEAEAMASDAPRPPEITQTECYPLTVNDPAATARVARALRDHFGDAVHELDAPYPASEDFGVFGRAWGAPSVFSYIGGIDPATFAAARAADRVPQDIPTNHSAQFAPVIEPTLQTGVAAMVVSALEGLAAP